MKYKLKDLRQNLNGNIAKMELSILKPDVKDGLVKEVAWSGLLDLNFHNIDFCHALDSVNI